MPPESLLISHLQPCSVLLINTCFSPHSHTPDSLMHTPPPHTHTQTCFNCVFVDSLLKHCFLSLYSMVLWPSLGSYRVCLCIFPHWKCFLKPMSVLVCVTACFEMEALNVEIVGIICHHVTITHRVQLLAGEDCQYMSLAHLDRA